MNMEIENIRSLLHSARQIVDHLEELGKLRGENFNVFSVLKMELRENATHSAFLGELLNPQGSHLLGATFLKYFLETIKYKGELDLNSAILKVEHSIGPVDNVRKTGGRIDLYITDRKSSISIENKINADDKECQIERYCNYRKGNNTVFYLTKEGREATDISKGTLKSGTDYFCISYQSDIVNWLEKCMKEAADKPVLRESIKQYINLIKKLTNQLTDSKMKEKIEKLISMNYTSAFAISKNIRGAELKMTTGFLLDVKAFIESELKEGWKVILDDDLEEKESGLTITNDHWNGIEIRLEGNSQIPWTKLDYGIVAPETTYDRDIVMSRIKDLSIYDEDTKLNSRWPAYKFITSFESVIDRMRLFDAGKRAALKEDLSQILIDLAKECKERLSGIEALKR